MRGTIVMVNNSMTKPLLYMGVERELMFVNALICYPIIAATHFQLPACLFGVGLFIINQLLLAQISKLDPHLAKVARRFSRYCFQEFFPARSHPMQTYVRKIETISRPK